MKSAQLPNRWARGEETPSPEAERHLRDAFQVTELLLRRESSDAIRAWFMGTNPELDDEAPAVMIREDPAGVLLAAHYFIAHG